jgi:Sulfotransferase domain
MKDTNFKVDFMIIGAMKSGTTTIANILAKHPSVGFCHRKEPDFFSKDLNWRLHLKDYEKLYESHKGSQKVLGEASTTYTCIPEFNPKICQDLYEFNPNLKFIYIMREPVNRVISHYMHDYVRQRLDIPIEQAIQSFTPLLNRGRYYSQIYPFIERFGRSNVLLITFENFLQDKVGVLKEIANFLEIDFDSFKDYDDIHSNQTLGKMKGNVKVENILSSRFFQTIKKIVPGYIWEKSENALHILTKRVLHERTEISLQTKHLILQLLRADLLKLEELLNRPLIEWNLPYSIFNRQAETITDIYAQNQ